jgi:hypothetical protein
MAYGVPQLHHPLGFARILICAVTAWATLNTVSQNSFAEEANAEIVEVRFGMHDGFIRVVIDSKGALAYTELENKTDAGLVLGQAIFNTLDRKMADAFAPLTNVALRANDSALTEITFSSTSPLTKKVFPLDIDGRGLHRLVIDLSMEAGTRLSSKEAEYQHLSISQEGVNPKRIRVQFADPLSDKK